MNKTKNKYDKVLIHKSIEEQMDYMREWFFSNYENPVNNCPYDSKEGGYQYIWGGPYSAEEKLKEKFEGVVSDEAIEELILKLNNESLEWSGKPDDYIDYYSGVIMSTPDYYETLKNSHENISKLLSIEISSNEKKLLYNILFVNVITTLEAFLSEAFIQTVVNDDNLLRTFVETNKDFAKKKLTLNQLFVRTEGIKDEVKNYLTKMVWHNLIKVKKMYEATFEIKIDFDLKNILASVDMRHDIVHRNGKTMKGEEVEISENHIRELMSEVKSFVNKIEESIREKINLF